MVTGPDGSEAEPAAPRLSIQVGRLPQEGLDIRFAAKEEEREALARFFSILSVELFEADLHVERRPGEMVAVDGRLRASLTQPSVVDLEPVAQTIEEDVDLVFVRAAGRSGGRAEAESAELVLDPQEEPPEPFAGDRIELGPYLREVLALAIDPYPRGAEASFEAHDTDPEPEEGKVSPFAALAGLKRDGPKE